MMGYVHNLCDMGGLGGTILLLGQLTDPHPLEIDKGHVLMPGAGFEKFHVVKAYDLWWGYM